LLLSELKNIGARPKIRDTAQHGRPALTRSNSGNGRAEWDSGHLNDRRYLGHTALPRPLKKKLLYWIFSASRAGAAGGRRHGVFQQRNTYTGGTTSIRRFFG